MKDSKNKLSSAEVLRYQIERKFSRDTVRRHYLNWREKRNPQMPVRCDNPKCFFHTKELVWNNKPIKPILDHINGNNSDNRPKNLRLLCPNCDSQLETRGGRNRGRIEKSEGGFAVVQKDGKRNFILPVEPMSIPFTDKDGKSGILILGGEEI